MLRQALDGHWRVTWQPYGSSIDPFLAAHFVPEGWLDAAIPEDIHATLRRAGLVRGHFMGKDPAEDQWIEDADWIYYKEFFADKPFCGTKVTLDFDGLDTLCDLYLNGERIGSTRNMFLGYSFDVTDSLRYASRNVLIVHIRSAVKSVTGESRENLFSSNAYDRLFLRKAQMNFAWDFCGRYVTAGIWKSVSLQSFDHNRIGRWYFTTRKITSEAADIQLDVAITEDMEPLGAYAVRIELLEGETPVFQKTGDAQEMAYTRFSVPHPRLWQPMPNGDPYLYQLRITLLRNGNIVEQISRKVGIRTVRVVQEPQEDGTSFLFEVNGRKLFARGANWVPLNVLYTDIRADDYQRALCYAMHGNINMLRVWGGGIYEYDCFYDLCDQYGILVCQDFMLACGIYPQSGAFLDNLTEEADYNIVQLRNHACLAAWMGDNENDIAYGWGNRAHDFRSDKLNRGILLEACARLDPERFYMPSSPCSPFAEAEGGDTPNAACQGDTHLYLFSLDPQSEKFYRNVRDIRPRFVSEFGFLSFPDRETYFRFNFFRKQPAMLEPSLPDFPSPEACARFTDRQDALRYYSGVYHSQCLKEWIEAFRALKGICWGCLYWKFNDPLADNNSDGFNQFPSLMSVIDFYQNPKMAYYYARRAYDDVLAACIPQKDGGYAVVLSNELPGELAGTLIIRRMNFFGHILWSDSVNAVVGEAAAVQAYHISPELLADADPHAEYLKVTFCADEVAVENRYFLTGVEAYEKLQLPPAMLRIASVQTDGGDILLILQADHYARNVRIGILDLYVLYSDNYFDMDPGSEKTVRIFPQEHAPLKGKRIFLEAENQERITFDLCQRPE